MTILDPTPRAPAGIEAPLPEPRGPRSEHLLARLSRRVHDVGPLPAAIDDPLDGEDTPLALHLLYELHYRGLEGVDERWEWDPSLLTVRAEVEAEVEAALVERVGEVPIGVD